MEFGVKPVVWMGDSRDRVRAFPKSARQAAGFELDRVQRGWEPRNWKPMSSVGAGVAEIRAQIGGEYRILYVTKFSEAVYVLHAFVKKTRKTSPADIAIGRKRYQRLLQERWK